MQHRGDMLVFKPSFHYESISTTISLTNINSYRSNPANCKKGWRAHCQWILGLSNPGLTYMATSAMHYHPC